MRHTPRRDRRGIALWARDVRDGGPPERRSFMYGWWGSPWNWPATIALFHAPGVWAVRTAREAHGEAYGRSPDGGRHRARINRARAERARRKRAPLAYFPVSPEALAEVLRGMPGVLILTDDWDLELL